MWWVYELLAEVEKKRDKNMRLYLCIDFNFCIFSSLVWPVDSLLGITPDGRLWNSAQLPLSELTENRGCRSNCSHKVNVS